MGVMPKCKECIKAEQRYVYEMRKEFGEGFTLTALKELPKDVSKCPKCDEIKPLTAFYKDKRRRKGVSVYCKECVLITQRDRREALGESALATRRKWAAENRERLREADRIYRESNRDKMRTIEQRRRARKEGLPDTLTHTETESILEYFGGKCALCDEPSEALDHFIPLATGCGGTTKENIVPLCQTMNASKNARNPFVWARTTLTSKEQMRFKSLVKYLADINGLTVDGYREFVFSCFEKQQKYNGQ